MARYVFVTGGVVSSLGKGLSSASLASLLQLRGYKVRIRKLDPYLNVDPGTMNPFQHGEVFVTDDGAETDLDIGHYERFTGISATKSDTITTGGIYSDILKKERKGDYLGGTVQVVPHVTDRIKKFISNDIKNEDFKKIKRFIHIVFLHLVKKLEKYHNKKFNQKYWKVILYPWLDAIIPKLYHIWRITLNIEKKYSANIYKYKNEQFISENFYEFEPEENEILDNLLPRNISTQIFKAFLENAASEQGSRMTAMDSATRNAGELVEKLTITYNRSRQAAITKELIEIISGAESL